MQNKDWEIPHEHLQVVSEEELKFILDHAEKQLKDTVETSMVIVNRTTTLLTVSVAALVGVIGFLINRWDKEQKFDALFMASIVTSIYLFVLACYMVGNIQPKEYSIIGAQPKLFFNPNFFNETTSGEDRIILFQANEIANYQKRIEKNNKTNDDRWKLFNWTLKGLIAAPVVAAISYVASYVIKNCLWACFY